jgi:hypothetical protein
LKGERRTSLGINKFIEGCHMSKRTEDALNALAQVLVENKGILTILRERSTEALYQQKLDAVLKAVEECEAAWAENERK